MGVAMKFCGVRGGVWIYGVLIQTPNPNLFLLILQPHQLGIFRKCTM